MGRTMTTEYSGSGDLNRSLELLWGTRERPARGPKPALTLDRIVSAAVEIADAEGLEALSMRRVAAELGVGTMSLYRYVPGKAELLDMMLDKVNEGSGAASLEGLDWRGVMDVFAREARGLYLAHPWLLQVNQARPVLGPNALTGVEGILHGLTGIGLTDQEMVMVLSVVEGFVMGVTREHVNALQAEEQTGVSNQEFWAAQEPILAKAMNSGAYPTLAQLDVNAFDVSGERIFEFGLQCLLDGLEKFIVQPSGSSR